MVSLDITSFYVVALSSVVCDRILGERLIIGKPVVPWKTTGFFCLGTSQKEGMNLVAEKIKYFWQICKIRRETCLFGVNYLETRYCLFCHWDRNVTPKRLKKGGAIYTLEKIVVDNSIISCAGPVSSLEVAFILVKLLTSEDNLKELKKLMIG